MSSPLLQALLYGVIGGGAMIPLTLGIWIVYATTRNLSFAILASYACAAMLLAWTPTWPLPVRVAIALAGGAAFGVLCNQLYQLFRRAGAGEPTQIIVGLVVLELMLILATGLGLAEPTWIWDIPGGVWLRGFLGVVGLAVIGGLLWARMGHSLRRVIDAPVLSADLGIPVARVGLVAYIIGGILCGTSSLLDSIDPAIGAGPRNVFPAAIQATLATLLAISARGYAAFGTVAFITVVVSVLSAGVAFLLPDGERLLCPVLLVGWLIFHPGKGIE